jgi:hypothetical protein
VLRAALGGLPAIGTPAAGCWINSATLFRCQGANGVRSVGSIKYHFSGFWSQRAPSALVWWRYS